MRISVVFLSLLVIFFASCDTRQEKPLDVRVQLKPAVLDFGRVRTAEQPLALDFYIENTSSRRLTIEKVLPSCGCTLCDLPSDTIPPKGFFLDLRVDRNRDKSVI